MNDDIHHIIDIICTYPCMWQKLPQDFARTLQIVWYKAIGLLGAARRGSRMHLIYFPYLFLDVTKTHSCCLSWGFLQDIWYMCVCEHENCFLDDSKQLLWRSGDFEKFKEIAEANYAESFLLGKLQFSPKNLRLQLIPLWWICESFVSNMAGCSRRCGKSCVNIHSCWSFTEKTTKSVTYGVAKVLPRRVETCVFCGPWSSWMCEGSPLHLQGMTSWIFEVY